MRVGHIGDLHLTEGVRFDDTLACLYAAAEDGAAQGVTLWAVTGDLAGTAVPHRQTTRERNALDDWIRTLAQQAPVVVVYGNHDAAGDLDRIGKLRAEHPIHLVDRPSVLEVWLRVDGGALPRLEQAYLYCLPFAQKRDWLGTAHATIEGQDRAIEGGLRGLLDVWRDHIATVREKSPLATCAFVGHGTVGGCLVAGGEVMPPGQEIEIAREDLVALGADYCALGHIHCVQEMAPGVWYAGSPSRANFGEETDTKGFLIADIAPGMPAVVHRRLTPARRFVTVSARWTQDAAGAWSWDVPDLPDVAGAEVRLRIDVPEEAAATCPADALAERLRAQGSVAVQLERRIVPTTRVRCEAITRATTLDEKLDAWCDALGATGPDAAQRARLHALLATLAQGSSAALPPAEAAA